MLYVRRVYDITFARRKITLRLCCVTGIAHVIPQPERLCALKSSRYLPRLVLNAWAILRALSGENFQGIKSGGGERGEMLFFVRNFR